jgi:hypothetical protein
VTRTWCPIQAQYGKPSKRKWSRKDRQKRPRWEKYSRRGSSQEQSRWGLSPRRDSYPIRGSERRARSLPDRRVSPQKPTWISEPENRRAADSGPGLLGKPVRAPKTQSDPGRTDQRSDFPSQTEQRRPTSPLNGNFKDRPRRGLTLTFPGQRQQSELNEDSRIGKRNLHPPMTILARALMRDKRTAPKEIRTPCTYRPKGGQPPGQKTKKANRNMIRIVPAKDTHETASNSRKKIGTPRTSDLKTSSQDEG